MKVTGSTVFEILSRLRISLQGNPGPLKEGYEEPFRSELYSSEKMNQYAKVVARSHKLIKHNPADRLLKRLDHNEKTLLVVRNLLVDNIRAEKAITPAAEWLLDNYYLIEEQIVIARKHLPKGYSEGLPYLAEGVSTGMPRVYDIVLEIITHSDGRVDIKSLSNFITAYQAQTLLTLGELWAIPIMLRLAVIENLRRVAGKLALDMVDHDLADYWADKMTETATTEPANLILVIADMARSNPVLASPFVAGFTRKLQGKGPALALSLTWLEQQLSATGDSSNDLVRLENQKQAADQVSVRNSIGTLRFLGTTDWREFVETLSSVEQVLRLDKTGTYPLMDFATRDRYRHAIEAIAKSCPLSETEVAQKALELSESHTGTDQESKRRQHIGYYLIGKGLKKTERASGMQYTRMQALSRTAGKIPLLLYLLSITFITLITAACIWYPVYKFYPQQALVLSLTAILVAFCSLQLAISLVNWITTIRVKPKLLPRMDYAKGIPPECRTLVIIPTMLSGKIYIEELIEALEIRFLANKEDNVYYGLLTDFTDADTQSTPEDYDLQKQAADSITALNLKYKRDDQDIFFLFHRSRTWNAQERKWIGYERKRGKLSALNALIRGKDNGEFSQIIGNWAILQSVKYIITLDSDTQLPRESVWKLVAAMAHPLNQAVYNKKKKRVTDGYGILQPRVATAIPKTAKSLYLRLQGDNAGIDPYTRVSSDVYQDLFNEGSFIGKGIYDVDVFEQTIHTVFPENRILSHDLLEGCYARSGLLSDVLLYEENPAQYISDTRRHHRWIRGDWQIGAWMMPFITRSNGRLGPNKLSSLSRWKILDNLRRSLLPLSLLSFLLAGWLLLPLSPVWTLAVTLIILLPSLVSAGWQLLHKPADLTFKAHLSEITRSIRDILFRFVFGIAVLPYEAFIYTDAVIRTNWRMVVSRKNLLQWTPSALNKSHNSIVRAYRVMWIAPFAAIVTMGLLLYINPGALYIAAPILTLWLLAPALAWQISRPEKEHTATLPEEQSLFLHKTARKTWAFFEEFITAEDHWLPPDNFQEQPTAIIAHRTSPTNMGLALLANLTAADFGYISNGVLLSRCSDTLQSMLRLERYKGHFYNWYDTTTLAPLPPRYVSTVDSGNLTGHLLTLRQGLLALQEQPVFTSRNYEGLNTIINIILDLPKGKHTGIIEEVMVALQSLQEERLSVATLNKLFVQLRPAAAISPSEHQPLTGNWIRRLSLQITNIHDDLLPILPWIDLMPVPDKFIALAAIDRIPSLKGIQDMPEQLLQIIDNYHRREDNTIEEKEWLTAIAGRLVTGSIVAKERIQLSEQLSEQCELLSDVSYHFLLEQSTNLLRIGYNVDQQKKDDSYYDLLASEARLGIFVGIAQGKLPQESWFALGRLLTNSGGEPILLSWSGSMFEYLMPQLVMPAFENTLLHQTSRATVKRQIEYAAQRGIPWGISESAYNRVDANLNYQYRAFGVPGMGLKRGLEEDLVVAPYASMLALMVAPDKAADNLQLLSEEGFDGEFGFYEAIDYTPARLPRGKANSIIHSYMVHHQGMGFLSLAYLLLNKPMQQRFTAELRFQATLLLLQERVPRATLFYAHTADLVETHTAAPVTQIRRITTANTALPEIQLLSNGRYQVMVTGSGAGYSRWKELAVTRWREDAILDNTGIFCYIKDVNSGNFWSNTYQPTLQPATNYEVLFSQGHIEFVRQDYGIDTRTEIVVSPEDDTEMRRIRITNNTAVVKTLDITSYTETVMAAQASDEAHPAFSNLFVQTEIIKDHKAILSTRRPRSAEELPPWMFHLMDVHGVSAENLSFETDRARFIGRGNTLVQPQAMHTDQLSGTDGAVLDPVMAIRYRIHIRPGQTAIVDMIYGMAETRASCEGLIHKYRDQHLRKRAFELSWTHNQVLLRQINASETDAQCYDRLAAAVIYPNPALRAAATVILNNYRGQSGLWSHSVSGDLPIVLLQVYDPENMELIRQMIQAHAYWRLKGLAVDLVIWNEDHSSYRQVLMEQIQGLITAEAGNLQTHHKAGNIFVKSADQLSAEDRQLFESVARVIIRNDNNTLSELVSRPDREKALPPLLEPKPVPEVAASAPLSLPEHLLFSNGTGGFSPDGKSYKIITHNNNTTPAPWSNIIANPDFGTQVSESGSAYTWALNAHEYRLTPWNNDPVSDTSGEAFYIRDEETGQFWSPAPFPARGQSPYLTTHAFGYSTFEYNEQGISSEMTVFVDKVLPLKFIVLKIKNLSGRDRKCSVTGFLEMILGDLRSKTNMHTISEYDSSSGALLLRNRYNSTFAGRVTFFKADGLNVSFTADRAEFIGRNRNLASPQAMHRKKLSGSYGAGMDPCAALQVKFDLPEGMEEEIVFLVGNESDDTAARKLLYKFSDRDMVYKSFDEVAAHWEHLLGTVQVTTPNLALNILANGWLTYQTLASRVFARTGFYQSGGAFGFRDQLQDMLALLMIRPELVRTHILLCASRQFTEGDVQHWWHPPEGRGVRTRCSDDLLWLPFVVSRYLSVTGDTGILNEPVKFLEGRPLHEHEDSFYDLSVSGSESASLYNHCLRAINHSLRLGIHGLPLIGSGDWNDGMDRVGNKGQGESIWLGFFLYDILLSFSGIAMRSGDTQHAESYRQTAITLHSSLEASGWDGQWYLRAYFDDGTPLGSKENDECRIDSIAQSWAVLSGAADDKRKITAMASLDKYLVKRDMKLIQLLDPAFTDKGSNPGYIKGYVPGVRENGGQYSHAAIWALMAFARLGDRDKVEELFGMIQPMSHTASAEAIQTYKVEPYVMAADVYANESHQGRGGWTWYTGSAGWMYQFIIRYLLGIEQQEDLLIITPCFPLHWPSVTVSYRYGTSVYKITVHQEKDIEHSYWEMDGNRTAGNMVRITDDGSTRAVIVHIPVPR
jgi:cyclic beta-1,2-glucan synthetase